MTEGTRSSIWLLLVAWKAQIVGMVWCGLVDVIGVVDVLRPHDFPAMSFMNR